MASLNVTELSKFRNGEYRWKIFERKIINHVNFELTPKSRERFKIQFAVLLPLDPEYFFSKLAEGYKTGDFTDLAGVKFKVQDMDGIVLGLTNLQKTVEFGSSAGLGGGTEQTWFVEKRTALECAKRTGGIFDSIVPPAWHDYQIDGVVEQQKLHGLDTSWDSSFSDTVDAIVGSETTTGLSDYHHDDSLITWIRDSYKKCRINTSYAVRNINKWNPADIWCTSGSLYTISGSLSKCKSLQDLSNVCYSPVLKGISLKKGGTEVREVKWQNLPWEVEKWTYVGDFTSNNIRCLSIKFNLKGGEDKILTIRPNGQSLRAEVKTVGSNHRNGCCGLYQINASLAAQNLKFRFNMKKAVKTFQGISLNLDDVIYNAARSELLNFIQYFKFLTEEKQKLFIADLVRHCVCQSRDHCTYLKVS